METLWELNYPSDVPHKINVETKFLYEHLDEYKSNWPESTAFYFFGRKISYADWYNHVDALANSLKNLGVRKGTRIAILLPNIPQFLIVYMAVMKLGGISVPINSLYVAREIEFILNDSQAEYLFVLNNFIDKIQKIISQTNVKQTITTSIDEYLPLRLKNLYRTKSLLKHNNRFTNDNIKTISFSELLKGKGVLNNSPAAFDDPAVIIYTGGNTGKYKGAVLSHRNLVVNAHQFLFWYPDFQIGGETIVSVLPFSHAFGITNCLNLSLISRSKMVLFPRFDVKQIVKSIQDYNATIFPGVPTIFYAINNFKNINKYNLQCLKLCISGGACLSIDVQEKFEKITQCRLINCYGLTEASPGVLATPANGKRKSGSVGIPIPSTEIEVFNSKDEILGCNQIGELHVKGPQVIKEYWKNKEETNLVLNNEWLSTGDMCYYDKEGYVFLTGRKKDIIISCGFNVYPSEVEEVLLEHKNIKYIRVTSVPDEYKGEIVKAYIIPEKNTITVEEIRIFCKDKLAPFKIPQIIEFVDQLPDNITADTNRNRIFESI